MTEAIALQSGSDVLEFRVANSVTANYGIIIDYPAPVAIQRAEFGNTITGTATARGTLYEPLLQWEPVVMMSRDQWDILRGFEMRQDRARIARTNMELVFLDKYHRYVEPSPQTRAEVAGAAIATLPTGDLAYFAQYSVVITSTNLEIAQRWVKASIGLQETSRIPV